MKNLVLIFVLVVLMGGCTRSSNTDLQFVITHNGSVGEELSGRVYIMLSRKKVPLLGGPDWFNPEPFFALDVENWEADSPLRIGANADAMDGPPSSIGEGPWSAIAVFRKDNDRAQIAGQRLQLHRN